MDGSWRVHRENVAWTLVGVVVVGLVAYVLVSFVGAVVLGVFLYYATRPVYRWLDDRVDHPDVNAVVTLLAVGVPVLVVFAYAGVVGATELDQLLAGSQFDQYRSALAPYVNVAGLLDPSRYIGSLRESLPQVLAVAGSAVAWALRLFVVVVVAFYLLRDDRRIAAWFRRTLGDDHAAVAFMEGVDDDLTTIYTGNLITIGITAAIAVTVYTGLDWLAPAGAGLGYPVLLGLVTGVATIVPAVGMKLVYLPYAGYLFLESLTGGGGPLWFPVAFVAVTFVAVDVFPDFFVRSYVSKGDINMGLMLLAYVLGAAAFGWYGVFLGPVVLVFFLHFARRIVPGLLGDWSTPLTPK